MELDEVNFEMQFEFEITTFHIFAHKWAFISRTLASVFNFRRYVEDLLARKVGTLPTPSTTCRIFTYSGMSIFCKPAWEFNFQWNVRRFEGS